MPQVAVKVYNLKGCFIMYNNVNQETNVINTTNTVENFNDKFGSIRYYEADDSTIYLEAEKVAIGLGFTTTSKGKYSGCATSGTTHEYEVIRWTRLNRYLQEFGYPYNVGRGDFIPENMVYRLAMKAKNENAIRFQTWLADEVIPQIRRTGKYDDTKRINSLEHEVGYLKNQLDYFKSQINTESLIPSTVIAKNFNMTAQALHSILYKCDIIYPMGQTWVLYEQHQNQNWVVNKNGSLQWTPEGAAVVEYILLSMGFQRVDHVYKVTEE